MGALHIWVGVLFFLAVFSLRSFFLLLSFDVYVWWGFFDVGETRRDGGVGIKLDRKGFRVHV